MANKKKTTSLLIKRSTELSMHLSDLEEDFFCAHRGTSMYPTLSQQDLLEIADYQNAKPAIGDVVFCLPPDHEDYYVHRIIKAGPEGIHTRGDNNIGFDPWVLNEKDIYGRVIAAHQGSRRRKIGRGFLGRMTGMACFVKRKTNNLTTKLLRPVYRSFCTDGFLNWLIPVRLTPQVATFHSDAHVTHRLLLGSRIIGSYDESLLQWQIRRPYRLFVDESSLPKPR